MPKARAHFPYQNVWIGVADHRNFHYVTAHFLIPMLPMQRNQCLHDVDLYFVAHGISSFSCSAPPTFDPVHRARTHRNESWRGYNRPLCQGA